MGQLTAAAAAELMDHPDQRGRIRAAIQFIMDWNRSDDPAKLIADQPESTNPETLILLAAVVHALCNRDHHEVPDWVHQHRATTPVTFNNIDINSNFGRLIAATTPPAAVEHGVYFEAELLQA